MPVDNGKAPAGAAVWHRLPAYRHRVLSVDIYDAVLEQGVRTPAEFDVYLVARGKPAREFQ